MNKTYKRTNNYKCYDIIYRQGKSFGESGAILIDSDDKSLFIPGIVNICLATEIFLKSINASMSYLEDEVEENGITLFHGRDGTMEISPGGKGHSLSKLFDQLPEDAKQDISSLATSKGYSGCVSAGLKMYDDVFVEWRYIYEQKDPKSLSTHPLFTILNAIDQYCKDNLAKIREAKAVEV